MSFDGITLFAVTKELNESLSGSRAQKVYQIGSDQIVISFRTINGETKLLISSNPVNCRVHITSAPHENPLSPPMFCMLLRKYIIGGKVTSIFQPGLERIIEITVQNNDEFMRPAEYKLIAEIMGKHSNIILIDSQKDMIIDSIKRVSSEINRIRQILPGIIYTCPPSDRKISLLDNDSKMDIKETLIKDVRGHVAKTISKWLLDNIMGVSGAASKEICFRAGINWEKELSHLSLTDVDDLISAIDGIAKQISGNHFEPTLYTGVSRYDVEDYWVFPLESHNDYKEVFETACGMVDAFFERKDKLSAVKSAADEIAKPLNKHLRKLRQNLSFYEQSLTEASKKDMYKLWGEILSANLYRLEPGREKVTLPNFYDDNKDLEIPLKANLTPSKNAQLYFKRYKKLHNTQVVLENRRQVYLKEADYLENILFSLSQCETREDVYEIRFELEKEGYPGLPKKRPSIKPKFEPLSFTTGDGFNVLVGKNNRQNDMLTFKKANAEDIWMHAKGIPGSHVIIRCHGTNISEKALLEASALAAYYSKAQKSGNVPVDYTFVKYVKKPVGAKPGFVNYTHQKTLFVTPKGTMN